MPPYKIVLLLSMLFIIYLFIIDHKRRSNTSPALLIPLIWMMIIGSRMVYHWLHPGTAFFATAEVSSEGSTLDRNVFIALIAIGLFILYKRKINWVQILKSNRFIFIFFLYAGISTILSDFPDVSLKRWIKDIGNLIMVLIVLSDPDPVEAIKTIFKRFAYVLIPLSLLFYKYYPSIGRHYHWGSGELQVIGVATNKNSLGVLCFVSGLFFIWNLLIILRNRRQSIDKKELFIQILFLGAIWWLLGISHSLTPLVLFILGVFILLVTGLPSIRNNIKSFEIYMVCALFLFIGFQFSLDLVGDIVPYFGRDATLTGRTDLWKDLFAIGTNPLFGTGYDSFWLGPRLERVWATWVWHPTSAHNGYIDIYLDLGFIGIFLLVLMIIFAYRKISRVLISDFEFGRFQLMFLILSLLYNYTESAFKGPHLMWFIFLLIALDYPRIDLHSKKRTPS